MGKVSPKERETKTVKQKRWLRSSSNKYLRPGALAQLRYSKASAAKSCTYLVKKRVALVDTDKAKNDAVLENNIIHGSPTVFSPVKFGYGSAAQSEIGPFCGAIDIFKQNNLQKTPKTPHLEEFKSESRLEALPMDLLVVSIVRDRTTSDEYLRLDYLKVIQARQFHFNYTTPDRTRQEMLRTMTPLPIDNCPFMNKGDGKCMWIPSPHTPKAPRHGPLPRHVSS